jgi:hypothetical protein
MLCRLHETSIRTACLSTLWHDVLAASMPVVSIGLLLCALPGVAGCVESTPTGITQELDASLLPGPPGEVRRSGQLIQWLGTGSDIVRGYRIYRECAGRVEPAGEVAVFGDNRGWYSFIDPGPVDCSFRISTLDIHGNEGPGETTGSD